MRVGMPLGYSGGFSQVVEELAGQESGEHALGEAHAQAHVVETVEDHDLVRPARHQAIDVGVAHHVGP